MMGADVAQELLRETQAVEAAGGLFLHREQRRRTPGGGVFHLARNHMTKPQRGKVFANPIPSEQQPGQPLDLTEALHALTQHFGKASTVKLTVIGRPTQVVDRGEVVIFGLLNDRPHTLPKCLLAPPQQTKYLVLVAKKQWTKVAEDDVLIIEGYPAFEPRHDGIVDRLVSTSDGGGTSGPSSQVLHRVPLRFRSDCTLQPRRRRHLTSLIRLQRSN